MFPVPELSKNRIASGYPAGMVFSMSASSLSEPMRPSRADDEALFRQAQQGSTSAFEELVRHYDRVVLRLAMNITGSYEDAQDIYQDAFLRAYRTRGRFRFECSFYTWIYRIATNLCLDHLRRKRARGHELTIAYSSDGQEQKLLDRIPDHSIGASPERNLARRVVREHIVRALSTLSPRERMIFELKHYHGMQLRS